jgi:hypothetical protein
MADLLFVVARDRQDLYEHLRRAFADTPAVDIVLDRRRTDRRQSSASPPVERRQGERRTRDMTGDVKYLGWALVRLHQRS